MTKAKFKFVFPKKNEEYEAQCNPMHLEPCTALIMSEHKVDLCMVYLDDTLQFICTYDESNGFQRYYKDNTQRTELYLVYGNEDLMELADSDDFEGDAKVADRETLHNIVATRNPDFYTQEEANAYVRGVEDAMYICDHEDDYRFVSEQRYYELKNWFENEN